MYQSEHLRNLTAKRIQCDEVWGFCQSKEKNVAPENKGQLGHGDVWTWVGIDSDSKLIVSYLVGKRDQEAAIAFIDDLAGRLANRVQLTTDGYKPYLDAVDIAFGDGKIDYAMLVKMYGNTESKFEERRYSPAKFSGATKRPILGSPKEKHISTSYIERQNLTMRMGNRRLTRLTNGFSKKVENLEHSVSLHFMHYNFARIHKTLRVTPAMAAGVSDHVWSLEEIANMS